ncbi:hypothetical protein ACJ41O_013806 [Fusarium nematophilum]
MPSFIERLPMELQSHIFSDLDYQSLIYLSSVNRHFHRVVDPQHMAKPADKFQFVIRAAKDFAQHRPSEKGKDHRPGNFECYICFRVRAPEHFDVLQAPTTYFDPHGRVVSDREPGPGDRLIALRRFCIECGVRHGLHAPLDSLTTKTGQDLWLCHCRKVWQKPDCLRCPECGSGCPLRPKKKWDFSKNPRSRPRGPGSRVPATTLGNLGGNSPGRPRQISVREKHRRNAWSKLNATATRGRNLAG